MLLTRRPVRSALLGAALLIAACTSSAGPTAEQKKAEPHASAPTPAPAPAVSGDAGSQKEVSHNVKPDLAEAPTIMLVDAGAEPRAELRMKIAPGTSEKMVMSMDVAMAMDMGVQKIPKMSVPTTRMHMTNAVTEVAANGDISTSFTIDKIEVHPSAGSPEAVINAMKEALKNVEGIKGTSVMSDRGLLKQSNVIIPDGIAPQAKQQLEGINESMGQAVVPLPEEPVGVGARWDAVSHIRRSDGLAIDQVSHLELVSRDGDEITIKVELSQSAPAQEFSAPGMPPGAKASLESLESSGKGKSVLDLTRATPVRVESDISMAMKMNVDLGGQTQGMSMEMDMSMKIHGE